MRLFVRLALVGLVALVAVGFWLNRTSSANLESKQSISTQGQCPGSGISLVIDFGTSSNRDSIEKCVTNFTGTSWKLFSAAGLTVLGTEKYPVGFVCRIDSYPAEDQEPCIDTPGNTTGSWAFFIATKDKWEYSPIGAASHKASCGTAEGWRFLKPNEALTTSPRIKPIVHNCEK